MPNQAIALLNDPAHGLTVLGEGADVLVLAVGLAERLGFPRTSRLLALVPDDERGVTEIVTSGGRQQAAYVTLAGMFRAMSQRPVGRITDPSVRKIVEQFNDWIYKEVVPSIFAEGFYMETERRAGLAQAAIMSKNALNEIRTLAPTHPDQRIAKRLSAAAETIDKRTIAPVEWLAGAEGFDAIGTTVPDRLQAQLDAPPHDMS